MILTMLKCENCKKEMQDSDKVDENVNIMKEFECKHFDVSMEIDIDKQKLEQHKLIIECKKCKNEATIINPNNLKNYQCDKCHMGSLSFTLRISNENEKPYHTPFEPPIKDEIEAEIINVRIIYKGNNYIYHVDRNDILDKHYETMRQKVNFPEGKKILFNNIPVDKFKSFKDNKIYDGMKLEIEQ